MRGGAAYVLGAFFPSLCSWVRMILTKVGLKMLIRQVVDFVVFLVGTVRDGRLS